jgi:predicted type IV restriction endonuclease
MSVDIRKPLKKFLPHLLQAQSTNLNEADTVQRLTKFFEEVLGYDGMSDISREAQMKGKFVDIVLKVDGVIRLLVEAKSAGETLRERHIEQAQAYASRNNYRWVLLTNGVAWHLFHLTFDEGIEYETAFTVNLGDESGFDAAVEHLALLHKQSVKKGELEDFWEKTRALSPASIGKALMKEEVLSLIRREVRREQGLLIDIEDLAKAIHDMLSPEARELIGPVRIRKSRATTSRRPSIQAAPANTLAGESEPAPPDPDSATEPVLTESESPVETMPVATEPNAGGPEAES